MVSMERHEPRFEETRRFKIGACVGALILTMAGGAWSLAALIARAGTPAVEIVAAIVPTVILAALCIRRLLAIAGMPELDRSDETRAEGARLGRRMGIMFGVVFAAEGVLIAVTSNLLARANRPLLIPVAVSAIVGVHFWPLGGVFRIPTYRVLALGLVAIAGGALLIPNEATRLFALGIGNAVVLWASAAAVIALHANLGSRNVT